ncbi:MAG: NAD(P)/FAD-dependent oxidoreductase [Alphaproteobacteria bacterium]|nr:NAD(P)/FAD-dependent oxidoreductase [Alphaproteobacteria bacterium]
MASPIHHVIIGSGSAGFGAAKTLRAADQNCRVTMITMDSLPFYQRYALPQIFRGRQDWRELLEVPPAKYDELDIKLRRRTRVVEVDGSNQIISLAHQETVAYDRLLVCTGGRSYLPENLTSQVDLIHSFGSYEAAMQVFKDLPKGGSVIMIGGDMIGIDLALTLLDSGYKVTLIANQQTFWPHDLTAKQQKPLLKALEAKGMIVFSDSRPIGVSDKCTNSATRCVTLEDTTEVLGDVVLSFCGLSPAVEFMLGADVDIERGILVNPELRTSNETIWAAGDVCQIWHDTEKTYKFYHGWKNVRMMGELAARNMLGGHDIFDVNVEDQIGVEPDGQLKSTFWTH